MSNKFLAFFGGLTIFSLFLIIPKSVSAQAVINEFSVRPIGEQDWVELYSPVTIDISNWSIADEDGEFHKVPEGTKLGRGTYYVTTEYQRLGNDKDRVYLYDSNQDQIDVISYGYDGEVCVPGEDGSIARIPDGANFYDRLAVATKGVTNGTEVTDPCPTPEFTPTGTVRAIATSKATDIGLIKNGREKGYLPLFIVGGLIFLGLLIYAFFRKKIY